MLKTNLVVQHVIQPHLEANSKVGRKADGSGPVKDEKGEHEREVQTLHTWQM